ncbi:MAG: biopolymer transporter ExbD [Sphingopyxis sp.]
MVFHKAGTPRRTPDPTPMRELNTTPLIDVMLCLLVMMILSIPLQSHAVKVEMPSDGGHAPILPINKIAITHDGVVMWNGVPVTYTQLQNNLRAAGAMSPAPELRFEPDAMARYVVVDTVMAMIRRSGTGNMGFVGNERYARDF